MAAHFHTRSGILLGRQLRAQVCRAPRGAAPRAPARSSGTATSYPGRKGKYSLSPTRKAVAGGDSEMKNSWMLLSVPIVTFALGSWQVKRKMWKEELIEAMEERTGAAPVGLPTDVDSVRDLDYQRVHVEGTFDHASENLLGPRTLLREAFDGNAGDPGMHVITPFTRADNGQRILVNRGFVPDSHRDAESRPAGQVEGKIMLNAIVYNPKEGKPNSFVPDNDGGGTDRRGRGRGQRIWYWMDLPSLAEALNTDPILVEATREATPKGGFPTGGQSQITIRNEHMQYIATWYSLSALTLVGWFIRFKPFRFLR